MAQEAEEGREMTGMYFAHGDLRKTALEMAIDSAHGVEDPEMIVARAEFYFRFLTGEVSDDKF